MVSLLGFFETKQRNQAKKPHQASCFHISRNASHSLLESKQIKSPDINGLTKKTETVKNRGMVNRCLNVTVKVEKTRENLYPCESGRRYGFFETKREIAFKKSNPNQ